MSKISSYPVLVITPGRTITVKGEFNSTNKIDQDHDFIEGKGYLDIVDDHAWVFAYEKPRDPNQYPYFWIKNGKCVKSDPSPEVLSQFASNRFANLNTDAIIKKANESDNTEPIYEEELINDMYASSEIFHPVMRTDDDFLKKIIKTVINELEISLSKYKYKMSQKYMISNMKSALQQNTKMSTMYFNAWAEMLGLKVTIIIESTDASEDKLPEPFIYTSERDAVFKLSEYAKETGYNFPEIYKSDNEE